MKRACTVLLSMCVWVAGVTSALASASSITLHNARLALESYQVDPALTAIQELGALIPVADNDADRREAAFLRAVAATDLWLVATQRGDDSLRAAIAQALGSTVDRVPSELQRDLVGLSRGVYASTAKDAAKALALLAKTTPVTIADLQDWSGVRRDLFMLGLIRRGLDIGGDPMSALEPYGTDPCGDTNMRCPEPFAHFDASGRKAIATLQEVANILGRLERSAREGDPLSRSLQDDIARQADAFAGITLRPAPVIDAQWQLAHADGHNVRAAPDLLIVVSATEARFGFVPRVRFTPERTVEVFSVGSPMLSSPEHHVFPATFAPSIRSIGELVDQLKAALSGDRDVIVALGATPDAPAHLIWRVLLSINGAGARAGWLLARSQQGAAVAIPLETVMGDDDTRPASLHLRVRLGGYTLKMGNQEGDIPRVKVDDGWRFDLASLDASMSGRTVSSAEISFMGDLPAQHLVEAAFRVAPQNNALRLVIPN